MGFFSNILEKLGIGGKDATPTTTFTPRQVRLRFRLHRRRPIR